MAFSHIYYDKSTEYGRSLKDALRALEVGTEGLSDVLACMTRMIDGDGSDAAQFGEVTSRYGFPDNATAKAAWDELNSLNGKFTTDAEVTFVLAAMSQAFAKFR